MSVIVTRIASMTSSIFIYFHYDHIYSQFRKLGRQGKGERGSHSAWERNGLVEENGDTRTTYTSSQPSGILHSPSLETQLRRKEVEKEVVNEKEVKQRQQKLAGTLAFSRSETAMSNVSA